jgi:hypothetical protein
MNDEQIKKLVEFIMNATNDSPFVLLVQDEDTKQMNLISNLIPESLREMLGCGLNKAESFGGSPSVFGEPH